MTTDPEPPAPAAAPRRPPRSSLRTAIATAAPLVAVATLMLGLRVGAKDAVRAAVLFGAPPAATGPDGRTRLAWQLLTVVDDRGVRETIAMRGLTVTAKTHDGRETRWTGATNEDGIAEVSLAFDRLEPGEPLDVVVRAEDDPKPLAEGPVRWERTAPRDPRPVAPVRPSKRDGAVPLDLFVDGERLVTGFDTTAWIRLRVPDGLDPAAIALEIAPEPGLEVPAERPRLCDASTNGVRWAETRLRAIGHVTGVGIEAKVDGRTAGAWFGALPVAAGAFQASFPRAVAGGAPLDVRIAAPNPRTVVYAEVDDERGRAAAAALAVEDAPGRAPSATFTTPPLADGLHWLVVSGEPRGAETLGGAAMAWPFVVGAVPGVDASKSCSLGPWLLGRAATPFARWTALDGLPMRSANNRKRHATGLAIALVSLAAAVVLEVLLLTAASREARAVMAAVTAEEGDPSVDLASQRAPGGSLAVALLLVVLGFALLAALVVAKG